MNKPNIKRVLITSVILSAAALVEVGVLVWAARIACCAQGIEDFFGFFVVLAVLAVMANWILAITASAAASVTRIVVGVVWEWTESIK